MDADFIAKSYEPVSCDFYDRLETFVIANQPIVIWFLNDALKRQKVFVKIIDLRIHDHAEWALLDNGLEVRLDKIIEAGNVIVRFDKIEKCT